MHPTASILSLSLVLALHAPAATQPRDEIDPFDERFTGRTLRFDYHHGGDASREWISADAFRVEGPWAGSRTQLLDTTGLGAYRVRVLTARGSPLWTRGFACIFGEWRTTAEARERVGTFHESQRFPEPRAPFRVVIERRTKVGSFEEIFRSKEVDPAGRFVDRSPPASDARVWAVFESGPPATKVDLLFLGDGYAKGEIDVFHEDVERLSRALFAVEPMQGRRSDFNVRAVDVVSPRSGITNPRAAFWNRTPLGMAFNALDSDRYVLSLDNRAIREIAALAPYDALILVGNARKYGGGGIFNLYATVTAGSTASEYVAVHELGHSFAGLADEYYTSPVAYEELDPPTTEPWEPNVTALGDPASLGWRDLVDGSTPVPTPWNQRAYDVVARRFQERRARLRAEGAPEERVEALFEEQKRVTRPVLESEEWHGRVGAFEGAAYRARGFYRPEVDCIMFTRNRHRFCRVCHRAIDRVIDLYTR